MKRLDFLTSDGIRLTCQASLRDDAGTPVLLFIPGWCMPARLWEKQLAHFSARHSVLAFDPRGQGGSDVPSGGYTLERRARDIRELLDCLPGRRFVPVCWSLAVLEILACLDLYGDERLVGLVLVDNSIGEGAAVSGDEEKAAFFAALRGDRAETMARFVDAIFRRDPGATLKDEVVASALRMGLEDSLSLLSHGKPRSYWKDIVYRFAKPLLYLVTPRWAEQADLLARQHPCATTRVFEQAGHALFRDEAEAFNQSLDSFLEHLDPTGTT